MQPEHKQTLDNLTKAEYMPNTHTIDRSAWLSHITAKSMDALSTHAIQIDLKSKMEGTYNTHGPHFPFICVIDSVTICAKTLFRFEQDVQDTDAIICYRLWCLQ